MTVEEHRKNWKRLRTFVVSNGIRRFCREVGKQFLHHEFECRCFEELSHGERQFYHSIMMLADFQETGQIQGRSRIHHRPFIFRGTIGEIMTGFLDYLRIEKRLSLVRIHHYELNLYRFLNYCDEKDIGSIQDVNLAFVLHFIGEIGRRKDIPVYAVVPVLRGFLKYTFEQKLISTDISVGIPKYKTVNQPQLPSTYSKEEIEKLICSIDRSSPMGKRNYVIILLAARLGLRASDITRLKFEGLHWHTSTIEITQVKTGKELVLPLLPDVGNAIIDYLRYGRPKSDTPYILLSARPPYNPMPSSNTVTHVVQRAFLNAGINIKGKRFGPHALRHSLGFRLLEQSTVLPVITEVLGHESTESTRYYLRIDLKSMRQCMLEVPRVPYDFYVQKGGAFYD
jgi:site-specific recombinase XerD